MSEAHETAQPIRHVIAAEDAAWRRRWPWLVHQDAIGFGIWLAALSASAGFAAGYVVGFLPAWLTVVGIAISVSLLHELEHDLIHHLYFKRRAGVQNAMFAGIWLAKGSLNPWTRRAMHLHHHRVSGQTDDVEERLIGIGVRSVGLRTLTSIFPFLTVFLYGPAIYRDARDWITRERKKQDRGAFRWILRLDALLGAAPVLLGTAAALGQNWAWQLLICWTLPNLIRHASLVLLSSYSHYYGDVDPHDVTQQNQILRHWALWPLQLFAFDFGATHIIHHYYGPQPFYLRHLVRRAAGAAMEASGTRVNDWGVVTRANRYRSLGEIG